MASHWPPIKRSPEGSRLSALGCLQWSSFFLAEVGARLGIPKDSPSRTQYKTEQSLDQTKKIKFSATSRHFMGCSVKNSEADLGSLQFLGFIEISGQFCLTRLRTGPIIGLFWQPSRSLPVGSCPPDGRGTGGHSKECIIERMQGHWLGRSRSCAYDRMIS